MGDMKGPPFADSLNRDTWRVRSRENAGSRRATIDAGDARETRVSMPEHDGRYE
jgi:hypothetical protein